MTRRSNWAVRAAFRGFALCAAVCWGLGAAAQSGADGGFSPLSGAPGRYEQAMVPRPFVFPADHGPHPAFRSEWWYFTGNLDGGGGERFGFQLTFFRFALAPEEPPPGGSAWRTRQAWMAHFALTDVAGRAHRGVERFSRGAPGLAGAVAAPFRVWLEDWQARSTGAALFPMALEARDGDLGLALSLVSAKPLVLQGDRGLSRKSAEPGNASYYYSFTRLQAQGTVTVGGRTLPVTGQAWMDREWSTSALADDQVGWDWFALHLDDGSDLMFYRLRRRDGSMDPASAGTLVAPDGSVEAIAAGDVEIEELGTWRSPDGAARYPARWRLSLPDRALRLDVRPVLADQEMRHGFRYWEGAVEVTGQRGEQVLEGRGYVELTGYAGDG